MPKRGEYVIELEKVTKDYGQGSSVLRVLHEMSLSVRRGEFIAIMGPSGSGKSTLLNLLGCLDKPTTGRVLIDGTDTGMASDDELAELRANKLGFVFQAFNLLPNLSALKNVEMAMMITEKGKAERLETAASLLEKVGLGHRMDHKPAELSGGEKQRVAIARAMSNNPPILLLDEPTGNLDSKSGYEVMGIVKTLWKQQGITIVLITHEGELGDYAQRVVHVRDGKIEKITVPKGRGA